MGNRNSILASNRLPISPEARFDLIALLIEKPISPFPETLLYPYFRPNVDGRWASYQLAGGTATDNGQVRRFASAASSG
jgi:hypothetical protein